MPSTGQSISIDLLTTSQCILENLLKAQELENRQVHRWMESKTSFVRTQGRVELDTISSVDLHLSLVILPYHSELDHSFRDGSNLEGGLVFGILLEKRGIFEGGNELCGSEVWSAGELPGGIMIYGAKTRTFVSLFKFWFGR